MFAISRSRYAGFLALSFSLVHCTDTEVGGADSGTVSPGNDASLGAVDAGPAETGADAARDVSVNDQQADAEASAPTNDAAGDRAVGAEAEAASHRDATADSDGVGPALSFGGIRAALTDEERRFPQSTRTARVDGQEVAIGYNVIARTGQKIGGNVFGKLTHADGTDFLGDDAQPVIAPAADFSSFLKVGSKLFTITHIETYPSAFYLTELAQAPNGRLTPVSTRPIDASPVDGLVFSCAGSVTPWNTHLGSEETDPNARTAFAAATAADYLTATGLANLAKYKKVDPTDLAALRTQVSPYLYGWPVEVTVDEAGATTIKKHYGIGRMGLENAYVMPDQRTVYLSDDASNTTLYMFVATTAGDLSTGKMYAAKVAQTDANNGGSFDLSWIEIGGEISSAAVKTALATVTFSDIFDYAAPLNAAADAGAPAACADATFTLVNTDFGLECLKLKPGQDALAARLETRRMAALKGATTEFSRFEGITFSAERGEIYTPLTIISRGMKDGDTTFDPGTRNEIKLSENICGGVYRLPIGADATIGSDFVAKKMLGLLVGIPKSYTGTPYEAANNRCDLDALASPDNVTYIANYNTLIIGEDTNNHQNDVIWSYNFETGKMTRIFSTPLGAETTGPYWRPNVGNFSYLIANIQHPFGESDQTQLQLPDEQQAYHGYIGPFPVTR